MMQVDLPWPPACLSPNARRHWTVKADAAAKTRRDARIACQAAGLRALTWERMHVSITFHAPSRRAYDLDNALARCKSLLDGLADATGVDDSRWAISIARGELVRHGAVAIAVSEVVG